MAVLEAAALVMLLQIATLHPAHPDGPAVRAADARAAARPGNERQKQPDERKPDDEGWSFRWSPGPSLRFGDTLRLDFHARLRLDATASPLAEEADGEGTIDLGRRRVGVEGELGRVLQFQVENELGSDEPWRDVYVNYRPFAALRVQAGRFKVPFSLDENTSWTNLDFTYRTRVATQLAPGRDIGVMVHGRPFTRVLRYELGVFEHDGRNARKKDSDRVYGGRTLAGRIIASPFVASKSDLADLRLAFAFTTSALPEGFPALRGETALDASFFKADAWVNGRRRRAGVELRWRPGPFSVQSEYMRVTDERRGESVEDTDLSPLLATGWYLSGTWAVTGERKANGLDNPKRPLLPDFGVGAIEAAVRFEALTFRSAADDEPPATSPRANVIVGNALHTVTIGVNWYLNRWIKVQPNFIRERIDDPSQGPFPDRPVFWTRVLLVQFAF